MNPRYLTEIWGIISSGGPVMLALAVQSVLLYRSLFTVLFDTLSFCPKAFRSSLDESDALQSRDYASLRIIYQARVSRQLKHTRTLIVAAPLLGLLGTVVGMLETFDVLSSRSQENITESVADGISVALTTTQTGLIIAIPALFIHQWIKRVARVNTLKLFDSSI